MWSRSRALRLSCRRSSRIWKRYKKTRKVSTPYMREYIKNISARGEDRKKTEENQMKGRRSGMKITSNECMVSAPARQWSCRMYSVSSFPGHPRRVRQRRRCCRITAETRCAIYCTAVAIKPLQQCGRKQNNHKSQARGKRWCVLLPVSERVCSAWKEWKRLPQQHKRRGRAWRRIAGKID